MRVRLWPLAVMIGGTVGLVGPVSAAADDGAASLACLEEIRLSCSSFESDLQACLGQRGAQFTPECRDLLSKAITMAHADGFGACLADIKAQCPVTTPDALSLCIQEKKDGFSSACRQQLSAPSGS